MSAKSGSKQQMRVDPDLNYSTEVKVDYSDTNATRHRSDSQKSSSLSRQRKKGKSVPGGQEALPISEPLTEGNRTLRLTHYNAFVPQTSTSQG
jgi:hypothetical protein